jgi:hypothetical protein
MVSRGQAAKVVEMIDQGWQTVPRTASKKVMGGPVLMRKGNKHVVVHPNSELVEPSWSNRRRKRSPSGKAFGCCRYIVFQESVDRQSSVSPQLSRYTPATIY